MSRLRLSDHEEGGRHHGHYKRDLAALQDRMEKVQAAYLTHGRNAVIAFEGWDASGKGGAIQRLTATLDPRYYEVWPIAAPTEEERQRHFLWRFWQRLPRRGEINIFDRTWYGRVLVERVEGYASEAEWRRGYDDIETFERQLREDGTVLVKLFMHITQEEQDKRFKDRLADPWKRWKTGSDDYRNRAKREQYLEAYEDMLDRTNSPGAPWRVIDGNDKKAARIAVLETVVKRLEAEVELVMPDASPELLELAKEAFGD